MIHETMDALFAELAKGAEEPQYLIISPTWAATFDAMDKFQGRDRRRIKREVRKAVDRARKTATIIEYAPRRSLASLAPVCEVYR